MFFSHGGIEHPLFMLPSNVMKNKYRKGRGTIKKWKEQLPENTFIETHRGVIVNLEYVSEVENERIILLDGAEEEYLSKRKYQEFKQAYLDYMNGNV